MTTIYFPATLDENSAIKLVRDLAKAEAEKSATVDFRWLRFVQPFPTLLTGLAIQSFVAARNAQQLQTSITGTDSPLDGMTYLKHVGFLSFAGLEKAVGGATGGPTYLPITTITRSELEAGDGDVMQKVIDSISDRLSAVIFPGAAQVGPAIMLSYCLREIIRNAFEHANIDECYVMAQRYSDGVAEIAIADRGIGVMNSLSSAFEVASPEQAIQLALQPGITSGADNATGSNWDNSGFGLFITSELGKKYGQFCIASSGVLLSTTNANLVPIALEGTVVKLRINTVDAEFWPNILQEIVNEGERLAVKTPGAVRKASGSSKGH